MSKRLLPLFFLLAVGLGQEPTAQLPQTYIDTTFNLPTSGTTWAVHTAAQFTSALNSSAPGDVIVLDAGTTYTGNFTLPVKANPLNQWLYITTSAYSSLPAPGTRVSPTDATNMPKIVTPGISYALTLNSGANHYRLVGLEVFSASNYGCNPNATPPVNCNSYGLISMNQQQNQPLIDSITIDRCYIHGSPNIDVRRAVSMNGSNIATIDSYINEIHIPGLDTQAIGEWYSPGPLKIVNNFLSASSEDLAFGGAGGYSTPWVPYDIEIRNNHLYKPLSWVPLSTGPTQTQTMLVKNNLEFKHGRRVLIDGNLLENIWVAAQGGFSLQLTPRTNQSGPLAVNDDITITNNVFKNVASGFDILEFDDECLPANGCTYPGESKRVVFQNNLFLLGDTTQPGYNTSDNYMEGGIINKEVTDFVYQHNTVIPPPNLGYCRSFGFDAYTPFNPPVSSTHNVWILDNALCRQINGPAGWVGQFSYVLSDYMGDPSPVEPRLLGNVFYAPPGDQVYGLPAHNYTTTVPFTYVDPTNSNYQLLSPNWTDTSDGKLAGIDNCTLQNAIGGQHHHHHCH